MCVISCIYNIYIWIYVYKLLAICFKLCSKEKKKKKNMYPNQPSSGHRIPVFFALFTLDSEERAGR